MPQLLVHGGHLLRPGPSSIRQMSHRREQDRHQHSSCQDHMRQERLPAGQQPQCWPDFDLPPGPVEIQQGFLSPVAFVVLPRRGPAIEFLLTIEHGNPIARRDTVKSGIQEALETKGSEQEAIELIAYEEGYRDLEPGSILTEVERPRDHGSASPTDSFQGLSALRFE